MKTLEVVRDTWFKRSTAQASTLLDDQKFFVRAGQIFNYRAMREVDAHHDLVTFDRGLGDRNFNTWHLFRQHIRYPRQTSAESCVGTLTSTNRRNANGELILTLDFAGITLPVGSGLPNTSPVFPMQDFAGSMRPIPEGIYVVEKPQRDMSYYSKPEDGIGAYWIPLTPLTNIGGRNGFLFHFDWNRPLGMIGTAGCIYPFVDDDYFKIEKAVNEGKFKELKVDYGFGVV